MIEINLLPGAGKKARGRGASTASLGSAFSGAAAKIKDPYLLWAVGATAAGLLLVGGLFWQQSARADSLAEEELQAVQDSTRYAAVLTQTRAAKARRDSVLAQLSVIKSIDENRYVWPHVMDEVSRVLPPFTWLTTMTQTSAAVIPLADEDAPKDAKKDAKDAKKDAKKADDAPPPETGMRFRMVGNTVDIQALTRFMKDLEASPFIKNVVLDKSTLTVVDGKQVTEFQLNAEYQKPDSTVIRREPVTLSVR